jgi:7-cyano-7-deazaguanine tRNA-ribosyltransferase
MFTFSGPVVALAAAQGNCGSGFTRVDDKMLIVAGLSMRNLDPRVWDEESPYYLRELCAVMVSYAEFHSNSRLQEAATQVGLRKLLGLPRHVRVFLDNGAFYFWRTGETPDYGAYRDFVRAAKPDWYPIPFDAIPTPQMSVARQRKCFELTMSVNRAHHHDGYVPVVHAGAQLENYLDAIRRGTSVSKKGFLALGAMVPNLLRSPKAVSYERVIECLTSVSTEFADKKVHVFGIGGTATVHLAALLGFSSADSSGWRNRAARGIVQLPGHGDRVIANLGNWRGRKPDKEESRLLRRCGCPACCKSGVRGLKASGLKGFCNRATHNLFVLLEEASWVEKRIARGTYGSQFKKRLRNSTYLPLLEQVLTAIDNREQSGN